MFGSLNLLTDKRKTKTKQYSGKIPEKKIITLNINKVNFYNKESIMKNVSNQILYFPISWALGMLRCSKMSTYPIWFMCIKIKAGYSCLQEHVCVYVMLDFSNLCALSLFSNHKTIKYTLIIQAKNKLGRCV